MRTSTTRTARTARSLKKGTSTSGATPRRRGAALLWAALCAAPLGAQDGRRDGGQLAAGPVQARIEEAGKLDAELKKLVEKLPEGGLKETLGLAVKDQRKAPAWRYAQARIREAEAAKKNWLLVSGRHAESETDVIVVIAYEPGTAELELGTNLKVAKAEGGKQSEVSIEEDAVLEYKLKWSEAAKTTVQRLAAEPLASGAWGEESVDDGTTWVLASSKTLGGGRALLYGYDFEFEVEKPSVVPEDKAARRVHRAVTDLHAAVRGLLAAQPKPARRVGTPEREE
jgi:hypothetical protein